jgi:hypothetical protein
VALLTVETEANGDSWTTYERLNSLPCLLYLGPLFFLPLDLVAVRETRDEWPLLTAETEANGMLGVHMKD